MTASGDQDDLNASIMRAAKSLKITCGNVQSGIDKGAVDVDCNQADRKRHCEDSSIGN